jgi:hypothetical protein
MRAIHWENLASKGLKCAPEKKGKGVFRGISMDYT